LVVNRVNRDVILLEGMEARRVGEGVRELRLRCGRSLDELARKANVPRDYLNRLEEGQEMRIDLSVLDNLRQASNSGG